jgi:hypothetical protein
VTQAKEQAKKLWEQIRKESYAPKAFSVLLSLCERLEALEEANERQYQMGREQLLRLEAAEKALREKDEALKDAVGIIESLMPPRPHEGSCNPESGCDGACQDFYYIAMEMTHILKALSPKPEHPPKGGQEEEKKLDLTIHTPEENTF